MNETRVPPNSVYNERAVLGAVMLDNSSLDMVIDLLATGDFYQEKHQVIFTAFSRMSAERVPIDVLTVGRELERAGELESVGGLAYLNSLLDAVPTATNIEQYAKLVRSDAVRRRVIGSSMQTMQRAYDLEGDVEELVDGATEGLAALNVSARQQGPEPISASIVRVMRSIDEAASEKRGRRGVTSGFQKVDEVVGGIGQGWLVTLAARPGMGKTSMALAMARAAAAELNLPALIFSVEMMTDDLVTRALSSESRIGATRLRVGQLQSDEWLPLQSAAAALSRAPLYIDDTVRTLSDVRSRARRLRARKGLGFIVVDYLQLLKGGGLSGADKREAEVSEISRGLKSLAKELLVPVLALSQLNREVEKRTDKRPLLSDLRESGSIEQDSDLVMMLYRDEYYSPDSDDAGIAEVLVRKHRFGPTGVAKLLFDAPTTRFFDPPEGM